MGGSLIPHWALIPHKSWHKKFEAVNARASFFARKYLQ